MPNWCSTYIVIHTTRKSPNATISLEKLHSEIKNVISGESRIENGFGPNWLGNVADKFNVYSDKLSCRGQIIEISDINYVDNTQDERIHDYFTMQIEEAWSPDSPQWIKELILPKFIGLGIEYSAEEPGDDIFINTDVYGIYISERYLIDMDIGLPKSKFSEEYEYFESDEDLISYINKKTGEEFETVYQVEKYLSGLQEANPDAYIGFHEFIDDIGF